MPQFDHFAATRVPDVADIKLLSDALKGEVQREHASVRVGRLKAWQMWLQEDWSKTGSKVYQWCKGLGDEAAAMILRPDGTLTCNATEADEFLRACWLPIFQMYVDKEKPAWSDFYAEFGKYIVGADAQSCSDIDVAMLQRTLAKMANKSACGADGWRVSELKMLNPFELHRSL